MPRPENPELKDEILAQARRLFRAKGYRAASYAEIAKAAGTTKGLVQYYFPKKDQLATTVMVQVLDASRAVLGYAQAPAPGDRAAHRQLYRIGRLFFGYLLEAGYAQFLQDVTSDLDLVETVLAFNLNWALGYAQLEGLSQEREVVESVVMTMGGFYSLLHYDLAHGLAMDVPRRLRTVMREFAVATGVEGAEADAVLDAAEFGAGEFECALEAMPDPDGR